MHNIYTAKYTAIHVHIYTAVQGCTQLYKAILRYT